MMGRSKPDYLLWSLPLWIVAILLGIYVLFFRGDGGASGPALVLTSTQVAPVATATTELTATQVAVATPTPTSVAPTATPEPRTYTVQAGDSLTAICGRELPDLPDCVAEIVTLNGLTGADQIAVGQELQLPSPPASAPGIATATPTP